MLNPDEAQMLTSVPVETLVLELAMSRRDALGTTPRSAKIDCRPPYKGAKSLPSSATRLLTSADPVACLALPAKTSLAIQERCATAVTFLPDPQACPRAVVGSDGCNAARASRIRRRSHLPREQSARSAAAVDDLERRIHVTQTIQGAVLLGARVFQQSAIAHECPKCLIEILCHRTIGQTKSVKI